MAKEILLGIDVLDKYVEREYEGCPNPKCEMRHRIEPIEYGDWEFLGNQIYRLNKCISCGYEWNEVIIVRERFIENKDMPRTVR